MTNYLAVSADKAWWSQLRKVFRSAIHGDRDVVRIRHSDPDAVVRELRDTHALVLVVGPGVDHDASLALARVVNEQRPDVSVVLIAQSSPLLLQEAVRLGVRDVLDPAMAPSVLSASLDLALESARHRSRSTHSGVRTLT